MIGCILLLNAYQRKHNTKVFILCLQVEELVRLSLNHPMRLFVDSNTDVADNLHQEFVRVKAKREGDREAIVTGERQLGTVNMQTDRQADR